jgi:hypothetical protein
MSDRPEGEAIEEMKELFGNVREEDQEVVCDDCFNWIMRTLAP